MSAHAALIAVAGAIALAAVPAFAALPEGWQAEGTLTEAEGWMVAQEPATISAPLAADTVIRLTLRLGVLQQPATVRVAGDEGPALELRLQALDAEYRVNIIGEERIPLPDACVELRVPDPAGGWLFNDRYFVRPFPHWYEREERQALLDRWADLPPASTHPLGLRIDVHAGRVGLWVDDRYVAGLAIAGAPALRLTLSPGNALADIATAPSADARRWVPVGLHGYRRPGSWSAAEPSIGRGALTLRGVPFEVGAPGDEIDVGLARWLREAVGPEGYTENYFTRNAFDSRPEDILLAVPTDDYSQAHLLCAVDPDPAKTPILSLRLTRYLEDLYDSGGRGDAIADSAVRLERTGGRWPEGVAQVGTVAVTTAEGQRELPLLQVAVPLRAGEIPDVIDEQGIFVRRSTQHLDLELTRGLYLIKTSSYSHHSILPVGPPSAVHVLAVTLERAPVRVRMSSRQVGNVFYAQERPALYVEMTAQRDEPFAGELRWQVHDAYGRTSEGRREVSVAADGEPSVARIDLESETLGWYGARVSLHDRDGAQVWSQPTSFAILPPDTRTATDSPFGTWWFRQSHIGTEDVAEIAPLLQRMGIRRVNPSSRGPDAATLAAHGLRVSMLTDFARRGDAGFAMLDEMVAQHPDVQWAMVYHESGFGEGVRYPPEFLGQEPPELTEQQRQKLDDLQAKGLAYARYVRERYPHLKLIVGNGSLGFAAQLMREGWPRELVDAWGDEDLGQAIPPEAPPPAFKSLYWQQEYAKLYGYDEPMTTAYEWRGRNTQPGNVSELEQARLYSRDALQALAFGAPHVNPGLLYDVGDSYYYSRWGAGGYCHRYPLLNPKPSYVAMATLTRELDGAQFRRILDAASPTLHVLEFARGDGFVYALWLPRGERRVDLTFAADTRCTLTDMNGNAQEVSTRDRRAVALISASPSYLRSDVALEAVSGGPTTCESPPAGVRVADPVIDSDRWQPVRVADEQLDSGFFDFPRTLGDIDVAAVEDERMGRALELTLNPQPEVPWPVSRYVILEPTAPIPAPGEPTAVGLWVRGNSCWGRVLWEFEDAAGERFFSIGASEGGWSVGDWEARTFINFDGWNYLSVELPFRHASGFYGPPQRNWLARGGDGIVDYPIRFTRLVVELRDTVLRLTAPIPVPDRTVRLRDLSVSYAPRVGEEPIL